MNNKEIIELTIFAGLFILAVIIALISGNKEAIKEIKEKTKYFVLLQKLIVELGISLDEIIQFTEINNVHISDDSTDYHLDWRLYAFYGETLYVHFSGCNHKVNALYISELEYKQIEEELRSGNYYTKKIENKY